VDEPTWRVLFMRFGYCFVTPPGSNYPPIAREHRIKAGEPLAIKGEGGPISVLPFLQDHGDVPSLGFRFGAVAYSSDLVNLPEESVEALAGLDLWIVDALRDRPHPSHFNVDQALAWIERIKPKRAILTNLHSDLDFAALKARLPAHIEPAYDGLRVTV
ncbi:MAG: MBL fold metallo-hydrolase, partial [Rhodoplanes sp.]